MGEHDQAGAPKPLHLPHAQSRNMKCFAAQQKSITLKTTAPTEELPITHRHQPQIYLRPQLTYQNPWRGWPGTCAACPACIHRHFLQHPQHGQEKHIPERCTWARRQAACTHVPLRLIIRWDLSTWTEVLAVLQPPQGGSPWTLEYNMQTKWFPKEWNTNRKISRMWLRSYNWKKSLTEIVIIPW